jgi:Transposase DDE domain
MPVRSHPTAARRPRQSPAPTPDCWATAQRHRADVLVPFTPSPCPWADARGGALDVVAWLHQDGPAIRSHSATWSYDRQPERVRIVAKRLPAHERQAAERRLRRKAQKHGRAVSAVALFRCGWMLLLTTLPAERWSPQALRWLYRARWQIELRMNQLLHLGQIRRTSTAGATATSRARLVAWLVQEQESAALRARLPQLWSPSAPSAAEPAVISSWTLTVRGRETRRQQVVGRWSAARGQAWLPRLVRFLTKSVAAAAPGNRGARLAAGAAPPPSQSDQQARAVRLGITL